MDFEERIWKGHFFWIQGNEELLIPQLTEPVDQFVMYNVKGKIDLGVNSMRPASTWCKYLEFVFWFKVSCSRIATHYKLHMEKFNRHEKLFEVANVEIEDDEMAKLFLKAFEKEFSALVYNYKNRSFDMLVIYSAESKKYKTLIPCNVKLFNLFLFQHLHTYFCLKYEILHRNEFSHPLWAEAEKAFFVSNQGKCTKDVYNEVRAILLSEDIVKRNICFVFFSFGEIKEKLTQDNVKITDM